MYQYPQQVNQEDYEQQYPYQPIGYKIPENPSDDFFRYRIDGTDILDDIQHQLKGEIYDEKRGGYVQKFDRWCNDEGINKITHIIYACGINKNTFLGNLEKDEIMYKCRMIKKNMALLFFKKYKEFGVQKEMRRLLITTVVNTIHSALSRSEGGKESDQLSTASQRMEVFQHNQQQEQKSGLMGRLPFFNLNRNKY